MWQMIAVENSHHMCGNVGGADEWSGGEMAHPHRVAAGAEPERAVQEVAVDRSGEGAAVGGHRCDDEQAHSLQSLTQLPSGEPAFVGEDPAQV